MQGNNADKNEQVAREYGSRRRKERQRKRLVWMSDYTLGEEIENGDEGVNLIFT